MSRPNPSAQEPVAELLSDRERLWSIILDCGDADAPDARHAACRQTREALAPLLQESRAADHAEAVYSTHGAMPAVLAHAIVRHGVPVGVIEPLAAVLELPATQLAPLLGVDRTTIRRYSEKRQDLPSHSAETVLRLAQLELLARETFETESGALAWLKKPHPMLEGETPLQAAATSFGAQRVGEVLVALRHGGVV